MERWSRLRNQLLAFVAMISAAAGPSARSADAQDPGEEDVWRRTQTLGTVEAYETYLRQFPLGRYTREAYRCAVVLAVREQSPNFDIINPPRCEVASIQDVAPGADAAVGATGGAGRSVY